MERVIQDWDWTVAYQEVAELPKFLACAMLMVVKPMQTLMKTFLPDVRKLI